MNPEQQRLKKLEFLINNSWKEAQAKERGSREYYEEWDRFAVYCHEYRLLHSFNNGNIGMMVYFRHSDSLHPRKNYAEANITDVSVSHQGI
jgi:hypothetical protein